MDALTDAWVCNRTRAVPEAIVYAPRMQAGNDEFPEGKLEERMATAEARGNLTVTEIAEILDAPEVPVKHESSWAVGEDG